MVRKLNPLKDKTFQSRLAELKKLGLPDDIATEIRDKFNTENNNTSHSLYILDWWKARLSLIAFYERNVPSEKGISPEVQPFYATLVSYKDAYNTSPYEMFLDEPDPLVALGGNDQGGEFCMHRYHTLRHMAENAHTNPVFQLPWPRLSPSKLIKHLTEEESKIQTARYFIPAFNEPLVSLNDGRYWTLITQPDKNNEAASLRDCATAENSESRTILLSLREPVAGKYVQSLLHAEIIFNKPIKERQIESGLPYPLDTHIWVPDPDSILNGRGIIVQLRGSANSKPKGEYHPYIAALLEQPWIYHVIYPNYESNKSFQIADMDEELRRHFSETKPWLVSADQFVELGYHKGFPDRIRTKIFEYVNFSSQKIMEALEDPKVEGPLRDAAVKLIVSRLRDGTLEIQNKILKSVESYLMRTKNPSIAEHLVSKVLPPFKNGQSIIKKFFRDRADFIEKHPYKSLIPSLFPKSELRNTSLMTADRAKIMIEYIEDGRADFVIKALFSHRFDTGRTTLQSEAQLDSRDNLLKVLAALLRRFVTHPDDISADTCSWVRKNYRGWGSYERREFPETLQPNKAFVNLLERLLRDINKRTTEGIDRACLMAVIGRLISSFRDIDELERKRLITALSQLLSDSNKDVRSEALRTISELTSTWAHRDYY